MEENKNMSEATPMDSAPAEMPTDAPMTMPEDTQANSGSPVPATPASEAKKDNSKMMIVIAVILLVVCLVCCGLMFMFKDAFKLTPTDDTNGTPTPTSTATTTPTPTEEPKESNRPTTSRASEFVTFDDNGIVIMYPSKWEEIEGSASLIFQAASPLSSATDAFKENVNVTTEDISRERDITLEEYYDLSVDNLKSIYPDLVVVSETDTVLAGQDAMEIVYIIEADGVTIAQDVKIMQIIALVGDDAYVVTYSATTAAFSSFINEVNFMINSFKVK